MSDKNLNKLIESRRTVHRVVRNVQKEPQIFPNKTANTPSKIKNTDKLKTATLYKTKKPTKKTGLKTSVPVDPYLKLEELPADQKAALSEFIANHPAAWVNYHESDNVSIEAWLKWLNEGSSPVYNVPDKGLTPASKIEIKKRIQKEALDLFKINPDVNKVMGTLNPEEQKEFKTLLLRSYYYTRTNLPYRDQLFKKNKSVSSTYAAALAEPNETRQRELFKTANDQANKATISQIVKKGKISSSSSFDEIRTSLTYYANDVKKMKLRGKTKISADIKQVALQEKQMSNNDRYNKSLDKYGNEPSGKSGNELTARPEIVDNTLTTEWNKTKANKLNHEENYTYDWMSGEKEARIVALKDDFILSNDYVQTKTGGKPIELDTPSEVWRSSRSITADDLGITPEQMSELDRRFAEIKSLGNTQAKVFKEFQNSDWRKILEGDRKELRYATRRANAILIMNKRMTEVRKDFITLKEVYNVSDIGDHSFTGNDVRTENIKNLEDASKAIPARGRVESRHLINFNIRYSIPLEYEVANAHGEPRQIRRSSIEIAELDPSTIKDMIKIIKQEVETGLFKATHTEKVKGFATRRIRQAAAVMAETAKETGSVVSKARSEFLFKTFPELPVFSQFQVEHAAREFFLDLHNVVSTVEFPFVGFDNKPIQILLDNIVSIEKLSEPMGNNQKVFDAQKENSDLSSKNLFDQKVAHTHGCAI